MKETIFIRDIWMDRDGWIDELCSKFKRETDIEVTPEQMLNEDYEDVKIVNRNIRDSWGDTIADYTIEFKPIANYISLEDNLIMQEILHKMLYGKRADLSLFVYQILTTLEHKFGHLYKVTIRNLQNILDDLEYNRETNFTTEQKDVNFLFKELSLEIKARY